MTKESKLNILYRFYDEEKNEMEKKKKLKELYDESAIYLYFRASKNPFIGKENTSTLLIPLLERLENIIKRFNGNGVVDYAYYIRQVLEMETKVYIRQDRRRRENENASFTISAINTEKFENPFEVGLYDDEDKTKRDENLNKVFSNKCTSIYFSLMASRMSNEFIRNICSSLDAEKRVEFINKVLLFRRSIRSERRLKKAQKFGSEYYFRKMKAMIKESNGDDDKEMSLRYNKLRDRLDNIGRNASKVPYKVIAEAFGVKEDNVGKYLNYGKKQLMNLVRENQSC